MDKKELWVKTKKWFNNPYNLALVGILVLALAIRLYFYFSTFGQPLWFDEAGYMSAAKHFAFGLPFQLNPQRPPLFQALAALFYLIGIGSEGIKILLVTLPSVFLVFAVYLLGKEMFDKKIGLIAAFLSAISWTFIFWTNRFQPDFMSMSFQVLAIFFMWAYWKRDLTKKKATWFVILAGAFAALGFYTKISALLVPLCLGIFVLLKERGAAFKSKDNYLAVLSFIVCLVPYFIWSSLTFGTPFAFKHGYTGALHSAVSVSLSSFQFFYLFNGLFLFIIFIIGLFICLRFLLYIDLIRKEKKKVFDPNVFTAVLFVVTILFYMFYFRGAEDRWLFIWIPFIGFVIAEGVMFIYRLIKKYDKKVAFAAVLIILAVGAFFQLSHTTSLINIKADTYAPVKEAGIWINQHSQPGDTVVGKSHTQIPFYSDRETYNLGPPLENNSEQFGDFINKTKPKYFTVSAFENYPTWTEQWIKDNEYRLTAVDAYFADAQKTQPVLIVYEIKYN